MTYKEIELVYPEEFARRQQDKLSYRYLMGPIIFYMDMTLRLEPLAREPVLIVGHPGILCIFYAYMMGLNQQKLLHVTIPLNRVIELKPHAYSRHEKCYCPMPKEEMLADGQDG